MSDGSISILLVDDNEATRKSVETILSLEKDLQVVGTAGNGTEGIAKAKELRPSIIIMDINMPDMDGIEATGQISEAVPTAAVIMMSAHGDPDYLRRAMLAGARNFITKPPKGDELINTIRSVYDQTEVVRRQIERYQKGGGTIAPESDEEGGGDRAGNIIVVYSPKGGVGCTTIATNLASGLMKEDLRVLLVDADLQFSDVGLFLNLQAQSTIVDLVDERDGTVDLDTEVFENVVRDHDSGLRILMGPARPVDAQFIRETHSTAPAEILSQVATLYDFVIVDTGSSLDDVLVSLLDIAHLVVLVTTPTLAALKHLRYVIELFDQLDYPADKAVIAVNHARDERQRKGTVSPERIEQYLKRPIRGEIPQVDERVILSAITKGVPVVASERDRNKQPVKEMLEFSNKIYNMFMGDEPIEEDQDTNKEKKKGLRLSLRGGK